MWDMVFVMVLVASAACATIVAAAEIRIRRWQRQLQ